MKLIPTYTQLYTLFVITCLLALLAGCQQKERPDELEMMTNDVLKNKRGIIIDLEPGKAEQ